MKSLIVEQIGKDYTFSFDKEQPFLKILKLKLKFPIEKLNSSSIQITCEITQYNNQIDILPLFSTGSHGNLPEYSLENEINIENANKVTLKVELSPQIEIEQFKLEINYESLNRLDIRLPKNSFDQHLNNPINSKILFSAPYGQGKTTFIDYFFHEKGDEFRVFKIFPVNYSVSSNEDIFKYIKFEIISQLLDFSDLFGKSDAKYSTTFNTFFKKNAHKIFAPLLLAIPKIGKDAFTMFEKFDLLKEEYLKYHDSQNINEKLLVSEFVTSFYEEEGKLYEDNLFSQIIRQMVEKLKANDDKKNVLLIEDLDRLDPDHVFRILNVLSAHFDNEQFKLYNEQNKFGFDKIILVCDIDNIKNIFEHRYGTKVDFSGYISKFYSSGIFEYQNKTVLNPIIRNFDRLNEDDGRISSKYYQYLGVILQSLIDANQISLREILKLRTTSLETFRYKVVYYKGSLNDFQRYSVLTPIILLLDGLGGREILKSKIQEVSMPEPFLGNMCRDLMLSINNSFHQNQITIAFNDNLFNITFKLNTRFDYHEITDFQDVDKLTKEPVLFKRYNFTNDDLIKLLTFYIDECSKLKSKIL